MTVLSDRAVALGRASKKHRAKKYPAFRVVCSGNSLTFGTGATLSYPAQLQTLRPNDVIVNSGLAGYRTPQLESLASTYVHPYGVLSQYYPVCIVWECRNHLAVDLVTVQQAYDALVSYCSGLRTRGFYVIAATTIPGTAAGNWDSTNRIALNALIVAGWADFADALLNLDDSRLQDNTSLTYFDADQLHMKDAGYAVVVEEVNPLLNDLTDI